MANEKAAAKITHLSIDTERLIRQRGNRGV